MGVLFSRIGPKKRSTSQLLCLVANRTKHPGTPGSEALKNHTPHPPPSPPDFIRSVRVRLSRSVGAVLGKAPGAMDDIWADGERWEYVLEWAWLEVGPRQKIGSFFAWLVEKKGTPPPKKKHKKRGANSGEVGWSQKVHTRFCLLNNNLHGKCQVQKLGKWNSAPGRMFQRNRPGRSEFTAPLGAFCSANRVVAVLLARDILSEVFPKFGMNHGQKSVRDREIHNWRCSFPCNTESEETRRKPRTRNPLETPKPEIWGLSILGCLFSDPPPKVTNF